MVKRHQRVPPVLFCNIAWMNRYEGLKGDVIRGGGSWPAQKKHEIMNFSPADGEYLGFVQPSGTGLNIERLGGRQGADQIKGVTVIWTASHPEGGTRIVGWYRNATVYRWERKLRGLLRFVRASRATSQRVDPPDNRIFRIPRGGPGQLGQSNVWYADSAAGRRLIPKVLEYIGDPERWIRRHVIKRFPRRGNGRQSNTDKRLKVEAAAMDQVEATFRRQGFEVKRVHRENVGWDLEVNRGNQKLLVEVKGSSLSSWSVELTPNEYANMNRRRGQYRLCVVADALSKTRREISTFSYSPTMKAWIDEKDRRLFIEELVGARAQL